MNEKIFSIPKEKFSENIFLSRLLNLPKPPEKIFVKGELPKFKIDEYGRLLPRILTVVGSRKNSFYSKDVIEKLFKELNGYPVIVLSGLALGIDGLAHINALSNNLKTIAIPGSGLDDKVIYPKSHFNLSKEILENEGCLISELEPTMNAQQWTFPSRNRIMSALSDALLIIEAKEKSGTMITGRQSLEQGIDIGVIPANIFSDNSKGSNNLLKEGAYPICDIDDLLALLHLSKKEAASPKQTELFLEGNEKNVFDLITDLPAGRQGSISSEELLAKSKLSPQEFLITISTLEMKGLIQETFGEIRKVV